MTAVRCLALVVVLTATGDVSAALAVVSAPNLAEGPEIVEGGLLWASSSPSAENVLLSTPTATGLLVPDASLPEVHVEDGWVVVTGAKVRAGRIGGTLNAVPALQRCPPIRSAQEGGVPLLAVAGGTLYAVVRASCVQRRPRDAELLVRSGLGSDRLHPLGTVGGGAISLTAAGSRVALTREGDRGLPHEAGAGSALRVEVLSARDARVLYTVAAPPGGHGRYLGTQLDAGGDVLVTSGFFLPPVGAVDSGWWGNRTVRQGRPLPDEGGFPASLSDGRIIYAGEGVRQSSLDLLSLATGVTESVVTFSGAMRLEGLSLRGTLVAWAQQRYAYVAEPCVTEVPQGGPELTAALRPGPAPPITIQASPGPRPPGESCPPPP